MKKEKQQSAVEWMARHLREQNSPYTQEQIIEIALEMEKEQIVEAFFKGVDLESDGHGAMYLGRKDAEQYYNTTFKSE